MPSTRFANFQPRIRPCALLVIAVFLSLTFGTARDSQAQDNPEPEITSALDYSVRPVPSDDRTDLQVQLRFRVSNQSPFRIRLLVDNYGVPNLHENLTKIQGQDGTTLELVEAGPACTVTPDQSGQVSIAYTISYDPEEMDSYAFGPIVTANNFHVAGCQWLLRIGDPSVARTYKVRLTDIPSGWEFYSTLAADPTQPMEVESSFNGLISSMLGGGSQTRHDFEIEGKPLSVFVQDGLDLPAEEITAAADKIVRLQRAWLNDYEQPFYNITVLKRSDVAAGTSVPNMFVCFFNPQVELDRVSLLFSHEMFHYWLPNKCEIALQPGDRGFKHEWFSEGFTEYFARRILLEAGLLSQAEFVGRFNRDLRDLLDNPSRTDTYADLIEKAENGEYRSEQKKLAYIRGSIIALNWETQLRQQGNDRDLQDFIRELVALASEQDGEITEEEFFAFGTSFGIDIEGDFQRYVVDGNPIDAAAGAFGAEFPLQTTSAHLFDAGFDIQQTRANKQMTGVTEDGPAFAAGLRDGMELVSLRNSARFSNNWYPDRPIIVTVKIDGEEQTIEYLPRGAEIETRLFRVESADDHKPR